MKLQSKVFLAVGLVCVALVSGHSAKAAIIDLTTTGTVIVPSPSGPALFSTDFTKATGSGAFDSFLRVQDDPNEKGYNTSTNGVMDNKDGAFTKDIRISNLATVDGYYSFVIDVNEANSPNNPDALITLDTLKIFTSTTGGQSVTNIADLQGVLRYDLDALEDNTVRYIDGNSGSGQADVAFMIPISAFGGALPTDYVILYAEFGFANEPGFNGVTNAGFEEFKIAPGIIINIPEVASVLPLMGVLGMILGGRHLRRPRRSVAA
jgi:hypothetical protein